MELVSFLGNDKENWGQVSALINKGEWEKVVLVQNKESIGFPTNEKCESIVIDSNKTLLDLKSDLVNKLKEKIGKQFEVALSIASGSGKEHMALISALLSIPVGIKIVVFTKKGIEYIN